MTREEIISMAREVSDPDKVDPVCSQEDFITLTPDELERFASMVAAYEREECANVCDSIGRHPPMDDWSSGYRDGGRDCASLIRAMCEK